MNDAFRSGWKHFIAFASVAALLSIAALGIVVLESGYAQASKLCVAVVYLAYWPVLLLGVDAHLMFRSFWVVVLNVVAWGLLGVIVGLLRWNKPKTR